MSKAIFHRVVSVVALCFVSVMAFAQDATAGDTHHVERILSNLVLILGLVTIVAGIAGIAYMSNLVLQAQKIQLMQQNGIPIPEKMELLNRETFWQRQYKYWTKSVPVSKEKDILMNHNYDGIRELDNSLPPWWIAMFYVTILFAGVYMVYYHFAGIGPSSAKKYELEMEQANEQKQASLAKQANLVDESNVTLLAEEDALALGATMYQTSCLACHGAKGEGGVGPNLTDDYWLHGGDIKSVFKTIKYGVPEKGMIAWQAQYKPADMQKIASFIKSLRGTNPPNAKEPQGELFEEKAELTTASDSTTVDGTTTELN